MKKKILMMAAAESEEAVRTLQTMPEAAIGLRANDSVAEHRKMKSDPG